jgi:propionyl-CoA carboxylase beta chain
MPHSTRRRVAKAFELLKGKQTAAPAKKHDNIPL